MAGGTDIGPTLTFLHVLPGDFPGAPMSPEGATQAVIERERLARTVGDALEARVARPDRPGRQQLALRDRGRRARRR